jgi:sulfatase modifying factor 1
LNDNKDQKSCCHPTAGRANEAGATKDPALQPRSTAFELETAAIPGGMAMGGTAQPRIPNDGEELRKPQRLKPFRIGVTTVTNAQFEVFVTETGYVTEAERFGWSFVFWSDLPQNAPATLAVPGTEWWRRMDGANWSEINGPGTRVQAWHPDHPVVHVSWNDARDFAAWAGGRLPSEAEWEHAARAGLGDVTYPWGERDPDDQEHLPCNIWQGQFPDSNTGADGYLTTAPAKSFEPNGFGLYNLVGNVWEWTANPYRIGSMKKAARERMRAMAGYRVAKGGSFLCHRSYCWRYRIAARSGNSPDSTTTHQGFRIVFDA